MPAPVPYPARPQLNAETGLFSNACLMPSPHCDVRPDGHAPTLLVVHNISLPPGEFGSGDISRLFMGTLDPAAHPYFASISHLRVSAHACIDRNGLVTQYVPTGLRAWHAGESFFEGLSRCNDFSIGIELEGSDDQPFTAVQYRRLAQLIHAIQAVYPAITRERIVGHSDIAPGRKTDPGPHFDWPLLLAELEFLR